MALSTPSSGTAAAEHENFHNITMPMMVSRQLVGRAPLGGVVNGDRGGGGELMTPSDMQNGSLDEYTFRSRSDHIAGSFPRLLSDSAGSSSHEMLHYDAENIGTSPVDVPAANTTSSAQEDNDDDDELREQSDSQDTRNLSSSVTGTTTTANSINTASNSTTDRSATPTPMTTPIPFMQQPDSNSVGGGGGGGSDGNSIHSETPSLSDIVVITPPPPPSVGEGGGASSGSSPAGDDVGVACQPTAAACSSSLGKSESNTHQVQQQQHSNSPSLADYDLCTLDPDECSMDFPSRRRSSQLVDPNNIHVKRMLAESKVHNLPRPDPSQFTASSSLEDLLKDSEPPSPSGAIFFTASGFSRLSPGEAIVTSSSSPTSPADTSTRGSAVAQGAISASSVISESTGSTGVGVETSSHDDVVVSSNTFSLPQHSDNVTGNAFKGQRGRHLDTEPPLQSQLLRSSKMNEVEMLDVNSLQGTHQTVNQPPSPPASSLSSSVQAPTQQQQLPSRNLQPLPSSPHSSTAANTFSSSYTFPRFHGSLVATPHVLGSSNLKTTGNSTLSVESSLQRQRANSNRVSGYYKNASSNSNTIHHHHRQQQQQQQSSRSRSHSAEGEMLTLEDFVDI